MNNHENFILEIFVLQCNSVQHFSYPQEFIQEAAKFTNPRKFSPSKILGYMVLHMDNR